MVYNMAGQRRQMLLEATLNTGVHSIEWSGWDYNVNLVEDGMYIVVAKTLGTVFIKVIGAHTVCANLNSMVEIGDQRETCEIINFLTLQKPVNYWPNRITRYWWYAPASSLQVLSNPKSPSL